MRRPQSRFMQEIHRRCAEIYRACLSELMARNEGKLEAAAADSGMTKANLWRLLRRFGLIYKRGGKSHDQESKGD
jgi:transcriptional regulator of acetoin/glycerol metabolism